MLVNMNILNSPWRNAFETFLTKAKQDLRVAVPYYGEQTIAAILRNSGGGVNKQFLLALSERDVKAGSQSVGAIELIHADALSSIKVISNLHAKMMIADEMNAIVTSSNMTPSGLDRNVEIGVYIDEPKLVVELTKTFDDLWSKAGSLNAKILKEVRRWKRSARTSKPGKIYGTRITFPRSSICPGPTHLPALGWILIHTAARYGGTGEPRTPQEELKRDYHPGMHWHWKRGKPLKEGGPYRLLFAWEGVVFGEGTAKVTRTIEATARGDYDFAFVLEHYTDHKPVAISDLPLSINQHKHHRDLIRLNERILMKYDAMTR